MGDAVVCTVVDEKTVPADRREGARWMRLHEALNRVWLSDAHFQPGRAAGSGMRFNSKTEGAVTMTAFAIDCDPPAHVMSAEWRGITHGNVHAMLAAHPGGFFHETRNGCRIIYVIEPFTIANEDDARAWSRRYLSTLAYFRRVFGLIGDPACHDYTRLFRLPRVTRPPVPAPDEPYSLGDPTNLGVLDVTPSAEDVAAAANAMPRIFGGTPHSPGGEPAAARALHLGGVRASQEAGPLHRLLAARGDIRGDDDGGTFLIKCPRARLHTTPGDDARLYPASGAGTGHIKCWHSHCDGLEAADWLREFSAAELEAVGIFEGVVSRAVVNSYGGGKVRLGIELRTAAGKLSPWARIGNGSAAWNAVWKAAAVEPPGDLDLSPAGDLGQAVDELRGRRLLIEFGGGGTRRILPSPSSSVEPVQVAA